MSYPAISLATATVGRYRCPQKRLQTARQPPVYPNSSPRIIAPVTPSPPSAALTPSIPVHRWIRVKIRQGVEELGYSGRWERADHLPVLLRGIDDAAPSLVQGATVQPFGLCHSEYHPTSLPIGNTKTFAVDWAQAYVGPGLLDLASWFQYGARPPTSEQCRSLIETYVEVGGPEEALEPRGSLPPEEWALFWNRLWVVEWFVRSCIGWKRDSTRDLAQEDAVERHLREALNFIPQPQ